MYAIRSYYVARCSKERPSVAVPPATDADATGNRVATNSRNAPTAAIPRRILLLRRSSPPAHAGGLAENGPFIGSLISRNAAPRRRRSRRFRRGRERSSGTRADVPPPHGNGGTGCPRLPRSRSSPRRRRGVSPRITSYNVCYTKLLRLRACVRISG